MKKRILIGISSLALLFVGAQLIEAPALNTERNETNVVQSANNIEQPNTAIVDDKAAAPVERTESEEEPPVEPESTAPPVESTDQPTVPNTGGNTDTKPEEPTYKPMHIYYLDQAVPYQNAGKQTGQQIIDDTQYAATWGGETTFSGTDGKNTHFIGHNGGPDQFKDMHKAESFIITDQNGNAFRYLKARLYVVDEYGINTETGVDYFDVITGTDGGERVVLQSTKDHPEKWIVEAVLDQQVQ